MQLRIHRRHRHALRGAVEPARVLVHAIWKGSGASNFSVSVGGVVIVSTVLSELPNGTYEGTHTVSGGRVQINGSGNVAISWSLTEVR